MVWLDAAFRTQDIAAVLATRGWGSFVHAGGLAENAVLAEPSLYGDRQISALSDSDCATDAGTGWCLASHTAVVLRG